MKNAFLYLTFPLVMACSNQQTPKPPAKTSLLSPNEPTRIFGVVHYEEKCSIAEKLTPCLQVKGGDDLNETKTFVLGRPQDGFEIVDNKTTPKSFRIWTKSANEPIEVLDNQHVSLLAELDTARPEQPTITSIESVARLEK